jgi:hypothetical protein
MAAQSLPQRLPGGPRKQLAMRGESLIAASETLRTKVADPNVARDFGRILERALDIVGWSRLRLAQELGYAEDNQAPVSRWIAGVEAAPFARIWSLKPMRYGLIVAQAEAAQDARIKLQAVVTVEMSA